MTCFGKFSNIFRCMEYETQKNVLLNNVKQLKQMFQMKQDVLHTHAEIACFGLPSNIFRCI